MKGIIEIEFESNENAKKAKEAMKIEKETKTTKVNIYTKNRKLIFEVESDEISPFHATMSSIIRNLKVLKEIIK